MVVHYKAKIQPQKLIICPYCIFMVFRNLLFVFSKIEVLTPLVLDHFPPLLQSNSV